MPSGAVAITGRQSEPSGRGQAQPVDGELTCVATFLSPAKVQAAAARRATACLLAMANAGPVTLGVEWCYEVHELVIRPRTWRRLVMGEPLGLVATDAFEGRRMRCWWNFDGLRYLDVSYRNGHNAHRGSVSGCLVAAQGASTWMRLHHDDGLLVLRPVTPR